jgi:hypothetical protein
MKMNFNRKLFQDILPFIIIAVFVASLFTLSVSVRSPWFGEYQTGEPWLTASTLKFSTYWYTENPLTLGFCMLENPPSIEFPTLDSRVIYSSYPPGAVIPVYCLSLLIQRPPDLGLIMSYNLFNHFAIALLMGFISFLYLRRLDISPAISVLISCIPPFIELFMPSTLFNHQNIFFSDQAVIFPIILAVFLEIVRDISLEKNTNEKTLRLVTILQGITLFYGVLTDWFCVFFYAFLGIKRILEMDNQYDRERLKGFFLFIIPGLFALSLYTLHLLVFGQINAFIQKVLFRTALTEEGKTYVTDFFAQFWIANFGYGFGPAAIILMWGSLCIFLVISSYLGYLWLRKMPLPRHYRVFFQYTLITLIPCFVEVYAASNHSAIHNFSILKFSIPLCLVPFAFFPSLIFYQEKVQPDKTHGKKQRDRSSSRQKQNYRMINNLTVFGVFFLLALFTLATAYTSTISGVPVASVSDPGTYSRNPIISSAEFYHIVFANFTQRNLARGPAIIPYHYFNYNRSMDLEKFIANRTDYHDIVFSPGIHWDENPGESLSISKKRIYLVNSTTELRQKIRSSDITDPETRIGLLIDTRYPDWSPAFTDIIRNSTMKYQFGPYTLYKSQDPSIFS